ncbi:MAG TPA: thioredoxin domain-containing protein, partial [Gaiellales bacterium]
ENPVEWYPWGEEALERARAEDRPILLSIGYSACHWCHVMAHESFEDAETAALMNRLYVNVKVDREERPDLDAVYMQAVVGMTGRGGWPMTVFLTPAGEPFLGGTYYPPEPRYGMPSFRQLLVAVDRAWSEQRGEVERVGGNVRDALRAAADMAPSAEPLGEDVLAAAVPGLRTAFDPGFGGFGGAPKFPPACAVGFLLREHARTGDAEALEMATRTLDGMALGGMHDLVGGGFHRYSVDAFWLVPHFEKMLYDNALLATAYLEAHAVTGDPAYARVAGDTLDFMLRELRLPEGGFASALDADTDGVEGTTYVWTPAQLSEALDEPQATTAAEYFRITEAGNFEGGTTILRGHGEPPPDIDAIRAALLERRLRRPQPGRDDKAIACWNGLALAALAQGGWRLRRPDLLEAARDCARFLLGPMTGAGGRLLRTYRGGSARIPAYLDDHAAVCNGLLELALATGEPEWLAPARRLADEAIARFADNRRGGFFQSAADAEQLVAPHKELDDNPTPSGNSLLAHALVRLARIYAEPQLETHAVAAMQLAADGMRQAPHGFGQMLSALDLHLSAPREVAVVGPIADEATRELADAVRDGFHPTAVYAFGDGADAGGIPLLEGRGTVGGAAAAYLCERFACLAPITDPAAARAAMAA